MIAAIPSLYYWRWQAEKYGTRSVLEGNARRHLHEIANHHSGVIRRVKSILDLCLSYQAHEIERRLAGDPPASPQTLLSTDFDSATRAPEGMVSSATHLRPGPDGKLAAVPVNYTHQVYVLAPGVDRSSVAADMARLSTMNEVYASLH